MKVIFLKAGEYRNGLTTTIVSDNDVENKNIVDINDTYALRFIRAKVATDATEQSEEIEIVEGYALDSLTLPKLKKFAEKNKIDISSAKNKKETLEIVATSLDEIE